MKRLNLISALRIGKSLLAPMVLVGLFLFVGMNEAGAQTLKNYKDCQVILRAELGQINQIGVHTGQQVSTVAGSKTNSQGLDDVTLEARRMFFTQVLRGINKDVDVASVVNESMSSFSKQIPPSALHEALLAAKAYTEDILAN